MSNDAFRSKVSIDVGIPPYRLGREDPTGHLEFIYELISELQKAHYALLWHGRPSSFSNLSQKERELEETRMQNIVIKETQFHVERLRGRIDMYLRQQCENGSHI